MFSWIRRRRAPIHPDPIEQFHRDVIACTETLGRELPALAKHYSLQVFIVALAMHLKTAISFCVRDGHLTDSQAQRLLEPLFQKDDQAGPGRPAEGERAPADHGDE